MKKLISFFAAFLLFFSCSKSVEKIHLGEENCDFCSMTIVDAGHAAQVVTKKGKNYKFDSVECMIHFLQSEKSEEEMLYVLTADYLNPKKLNNAAESSFLISEEIFSPMGAFLSAFKNEADAKKVQAEHGGDIYTWEEIKKQIHENH